MDKSSIAVVVATPSMAYAAAPVYFDLGGAVLLLAFYGMGAVGIFIWLAKGRSRYRWKALGALLYFIVIPGYPVAEKMHLQSKQKEVEKQQYNAQFEAGAAFVRFCEENLKREQPLEACKKFRPLEPNEDQLVTK